MGGDDEGVRVHYGTPLVSEEELNPRKRKAALDQGQARQVAPWNQEVSVSNLVLIRQARFRFFQSMAQRISNLFRICFLYCYSPFWLRWELFDFSSHSIGQWNRSQILKAVDGFMGHSAEGFLQGTSTLWVQRKVGPNQFGIFTQSASTIGLSILLCCVRLHLLTNLKWLSALVNSLCGILQDGLHKRSPPLDRYEQTRRHRLRTILWMKTRRRYDLWNWWSRTYPVLVILFWTLITIAGYYILPFGLRLSWFRLPEKCRCWPNFSFSCNWYRRWYQVESGLQFWREAIATKCRPCFAVI